MKTKAKQNFKLDDFLNDPEFKDYILNNKNSESWEKYISSDPDNLPVFYNAKEILQELHSTYQKLEQSKDEVDLHYSKFENIKKDQSNKQVHTHHKRLYLSNLVKISACIILLAGIISISYYFLTPNQTEVQNSIEYVTTSAEQKTITLPDSSIVTLNGNSKLTLNNFTVKGRRTVNFEGQGFFDVKKARDKGNQFVIETKNSKVTVLGTKFDFIHTLSGVELSLEEGLVNLEYGLNNTHPQNLKINPGEAIQIDQDGKLTLHTLKNNSINSSWKTGFFEYESHALSKIFSDVERQFNVLFENKSSTALSKKISGVIPTNNLEEALTVLEILIDKKLEFKDESTITIL